MSATSLSPSLLPRSAIRDRRRCVLRSGMIMRQRKVCLGVPENANATATIIATPPAPSPLPSWLGEVGPKSVEIGAIFSVES